MNPLLNRYHAQFSWGVLLLLLATGLFVLITAVLDQHDRYRFELLKDERTLQRLLSIENSRDRLETARNAFQANNLAEWVFPADQSPEAVSLSIQRTVSDALTASKANIRSIAPLRSAPREGFVSVGVSAQFSAGLNTLVQVVGAIEESRPMLAIENLRLVAAAPRSVMQGPPPQTLEVVMNVVTYIPSAGEGATP